MACLSELRVGCLSSADYGWSKYGLLTSGIHAPRSVRTRRQQVRRNRRFVEVVVSDRYSRAKVGVCSCVASDRKKCDHSFLPPVTDPVARSDSATRKEKNLSFLSVSVSAPGKTLTSLTSLTFLIWKPNRSHSVRQASYAVQTTRSRGQRKVSEVSGSYSVRHVRSCASTAASPVPGPCVSRGDPSRLATTQKSKVIACVPMHFAGRCQLPEGRTYRALCARRAIRARPQIPFCRDDPPCPPILL